MNDFTASNGHEILIEEERVRVVDAGGANVLDLFDYFDQSDMQALREFFQAEADERLGRWRWPKNPDYVVYPKENGLFEVLHEPTGLVLTSTVSGHAPFSDEHAQAARAYLAAHPEPKPWHDAAEGEVWEVAVANQEPALYVVEGASNRFIHVERRLLALDITAAEIVAGRRIWPEVQS